VKESYIYFWAKARITTIKLPNTHRHTNWKYSVDNLREFFRLNMTLINTYVNILFVYIEGIIVEKKTKKYDDVLFLQKKLTTNLNPSIKFITWQATLLSFPHSFSSIFLNNKHLLFYHKSTSHYKFNHPNTQFTSILIHIQILLNLHFK